MFIIQLHVFDLDAFNCKMNYRVSPTVKYFYRFPNSVDNTKQLHCVGFLERNEFRKLRYLPQYIID